MTRPRTPPFEPVNFGPLVLELEAALRGGPRRRLVDCRICGGPMIDYGQDAHTACVRPDGGRTVADLDVPLDHDPTGSPPWRSGIEAARRALATAAPFVAVEAERDEVLDRPLPAPRLCSGPARPGSWNSEACGLSADDSGLCWFHREGLDG